MLKPVGARLQTSCASLTQLVRTQRPTDAGRLECSLHQALGACVPQVPSLLQPVCGASLKTLLRSQAGAEAGAWLMAITADRADAVLLRHVALLLA